ncbi:MAG TPA: RNA methyltransferase substrate-binding domain-containing protein, partial [Halomonas sp.]|nr:RNA methyltransferase substrate-binding domain-containing protein [Halomonas sp.]
MKPASTRRGPRSHSGAAPKAPGGLDQVYGVHALQSLLDRGEAPRELWMQQGAGNRVKELVAQAQSQGAQVKEQSREVLDQLTQGAAHQGIVAFCLSLTPEGEESLWLKLRAWPASTPPLL